MLATTFTSGIPGWALLSAGFGICALSIAISRHSNVGTRNRRLLDAIDNMSQGLSMFDAQTRIVLRQPPLSRDVQAVARHREAGLHAAPADRAPQRDRPVRRRRRLLLPAHPRQHEERHQHADLRAGERRPYRARQERAAAGRRLGVDARGRHRTSPRRGRAGGEPRAGTAPFGRRRDDRRLPADRRAAARQRRRQRQRHAHDGGGAVRLFRADDDARRQRRAGVPRPPRSTSIRRPARPTSCRIRSPRSAASWRRPARSWRTRPRRRDRPTTRSPASPPARRRSATWSSSSATLPGRPICWRSTPPSKRRAPANPAGASPWSPPR